VPLSTLGVPLSTLSLGVGVPLSTLILPIPPVCVQTFGNHEFDKGPSVLAAYLQNLKVPVTTSNIYVTNSSNPLSGLIVPGPVTTLLKLAEGQYVRVGICGFTTTDTPDISSPGPGVVFAPLVSSVTTCVQQLQAAGVTVIVGLGHAGIPGATSRWPPRCRVSPTTTTSRHHSPPDPDCTV